MGIDIAKHISELLYDHDSVIVPGLGGIVASYQPASIDHVQGQLHPPSKKLSFNENLVINDGLLADYIKHQNGISLKESVEIISRFVAGTKEKLNNKEIVILPEIGRLYKDYENSLRFLQDTTNFNTDAFGLPTLHFYPILRSQEPPSVKKSKTVNLVTDKHHPAAKKPLVRKIASIFLPLFLALIIVAVVVGVFKKQNNEIEGFSAQKIPVNENRLNKKPSIDNISFFESLPENEPVENLFENGAMTDTSETSKIEFEDNAIAKTQKECVIIIGVYSKKTSVEQRLKDIYDQGYVAFQDKVGSMTRVGVLFSYDKYSEIENMLQVIHEKFDDRAWILKE